MRLRHTLVCTLALLALTGVTIVPSQADEVDPLSTGRFTNNGLLAQSDRDRRLWLSGVVVGLSNGVGLQNVEAGSCIYRWYFDDEAQVYANVLSNIERYPDHEPAVIVIALARRSCPEIE